MNLVTKRTAAATSALSLLVASSLVGGVSAMSSASATKSANEQTRVTAIIAAGDKEIGRRLATLNTLSSKINGATKLSANDKATLSGEVSSEVSGLTALKTKLDSETTLDGAKADAQSIYTDYRVYALIVPKVELVRVADDQQAVEGKLTNLATKLQARITTAKSNGKDVTSLQSQLNDMVAKTQAAQTISAHIESKVISLQPSDYNTDHTVLSGDRDLLKTARSNNQAAYADAKNIVAGLKSI